MSCPLRQARSMSYSTRFRCCGAAVPLALILAASAGQSRAEEIRLDALKIPVAISGSSGPASVALEAIVVRPDDGLPHPLAVLNHGSPRTAGNRPTMSPYRMWAQAVAFARRGWVAVAFMRGGYGRSEGGWAENYGSCSNPDYATARRAGASDIAAVAQFMTTQHYVGKGKWIGVGVSAAGPSLKRARSAGFLLTRRACQLRDRQRQRQADRMRAIKCTCRRCGTGQVMAMVVVTLAIVS